MPSTTRTLLSLAACFVLCGVPNLASGFSVYTYDLPAKYNEDVLRMPLDREKNSWAIWYDTDKVWLFIPADTYPLYPLMSQEVLKPKYFKTGHILGPGTPFVL